jgi:hypothetical protein
MRGASGGGVAGGIALSNQQSAFSRYAESPTSHDIAVIENPKENKFHRGDAEEMGKGWLRLDT